MKKPVYTFKTTPFNHQAERFHGHKDDEFEAIFWDMGLGKSKYVLDRAGYLYRSNKIRCLILVSPKGVHMDHISEAVPDHLPDDIPRMTFCWTGKSKLPKKDQKQIDMMLDDRRSGLRILSSNMDAVRHKSRGLKLALQFAEAFPCLVCIDEASDFKNPGTDRSKGLLGYRNAQGLKHHADYRVILDGTPITEGPCDFYVPCTFLHEKIFGIPSYVAFRAKYEKVFAPFLRRDLSPVLGDMELIARITGQRLHGYLSVQDLRNLGVPENKLSYVRTICNKTPILSDGVRNLDDLKAKIKPYSDRKMKTECLDLPEKLYTVIHHEMSPAQKKLYTTLEHDLRVEMDNGELLSVEHVLTLYLRLQEILGGHYTPEDGIRKPIDGKNYRLQSMLDYIGHISQENKVIIWARFTSEIDMIHTALCKEYGEDSTVVYDGRLTDNQKQSSKEQFTTNPNVRFFVGNQKAGSVGLNLQVANYAIYYSNDFSLRTRLQSEDRAYRAGQTKNVTIVDLMCKDTIDETIVKALRNKKNVAEAVV